MASALLNQPKPRPQNPTYSSTLIQSAMLYPDSKYQIIRENLVNSKSMLFTQNPSNMQNQSTVSSIQAQIRNTHKNLGIQPKNMLRKNSSMGDLTKNNQAFRIRRSSSNLSSYGTNSLSNIFKLNDKQVYERQQKDFNIVNGTPTPYKQSIRVFPKLRYERILQEPHKIRQAFISGKPQLGLQYQKLYRSKLLQASSYTQNPKFKRFEKKINPQNSELIMK